MNIKAWKVTSCPVYMYINMHMKICNGISLMCQFSDSADRLMTKKIFSSIIWHPSSSHKLKHTFFSGKQKLLLSFFMIKPSRIKTNVMNITQKIFRAAFSWMRS